MSTDQIRSREDGSRIERRMQTCPATGEAYPVFSLYDDRGGRPYGSYLSPGARFETFRNEAGAYGREVDPNPANPLRDEIERFAAAGYPLLAEKLAAKTPPRAEPFPDALFQPGQIGYGPGLTKLYVTHDDILGFVRRHIAGDHGVFGCSTTVEPTEEETFCDIDIPLAKKNAVAIRRGFGLVVSRFQMWNPGVTDAAENAWKAAHHPSQVYPLRRDDVLTVVTLLTRNGDSKTAVCDGRAGHHCSF